MLTDEELCRRSVLLALDHIDAMEKLAAVGGRPDITDIKAVYLFRREMECLTFEANRRRTCGKAVQ